MNAQDEESREPNAIYLSIPPRYFYVPGAALTVGIAIGLVRGSRRASLRFLAENVHRPPTTVQGWYFYNKTKNYKVLLGGLQEAGKDAIKLGTAAFGWVGLEDGLERIGWGGISEVGAGLGTAGLFSAVYRLAWKTARRTLILGVIIGGGMRTLRWTRAVLENETRHAADRKVHKVRESAGLAGK